MATWNDKRTPAGVYTDSHTGAHVNAAGKPVYQLPASSSVQQLKAAAVEAESSAFAKARPKKAVTAKPAGMRKPA